MRVRGAEAWEGALQLSGKGDAAGLRSSAAEDRGWETADVGPMRLSLEVTAALTWCGCQGTVRFPAKPAWDADWHAPWEPGSYQL